MAILCQVDLIFAWHLCQKVFANLCFITSTTDPFYHTCYIYTVHIPRHDTSIVFSAWIWTLAPTRVVVIWFRRILADPVKEFWATLRPAWQTACFYIILDVTESIIHIIARITNVTFFVALCKSERMKELQFTNHCIGEFSGKLDWEMASFFAWFRTTLQ